MTVASSSGWRWHHRRANDIARLESEESDSGSKQLTFGEGMGLRVKMTSFLRGGNKKKKKNSFELLDSSKTWQVN